MAALFGRHGGIGGGNEVSIGYWELWLLQAEGNVAMPRLEFFAAEDVPLGALLTFGPHDAVGIIKSSAAQKCLESQQLSIQWYVLRLP